MATWKKVMLAGAASINDLTDVTIAGASDAQILVHDGTDFDNVSVSGDVTITNAGAVTIGNDKVTTVKILDSNVTLAKIANIANSTVLGNASGSAAAPSALTIDTDLSAVSASDDTLASAKAIKTYVDSEISNSGGGTVTGVDITGDSGTFTEQTSGVTIEFTTGAGITSAVGDDIDGSGNPGVSHSIDASQTAITSILNTSLKMGRDADNVIDFATTDNAIIFRANGANQLKIDDGNLVPLTDGDIALGSNSVRFSNGYFDSITTTSGTVQGNLSVGGNATVTGNLTVNGTTTTVNTTNLNVEDHIILVATNDTPTPDTGTAAGLEVETSGTAGHRPRFEWTKDEGASNDGTYDGSGTGTGLTGWKLSNHQETNQAYFPISVMEMVGNSASAPTGDSAGVGSFFFASSNIGVADGELYLRVK